MKALAGSRFAIDGVVARGRTTTVYSAHDRHRRERVALKLLTSAAPAAAGTADRLRHEAQALRRLSHPNIVRLRDAGEIDGAPFVAMELVDGETLRAWLVGGPRRWHDVVAAFVQAGRGLAAVHAAGMLHRDFKPENVMIDVHGNARLIDFGAACCTPAREEFVGTPAYMAPEQFTGSRIDRLADQFSFCVSLYEALHGMRPFEGRTLEALAFTVTAGKISAPPRVPRVPAEVRRVVRRGLALSPRERYASMEALLVALRRTSA